MIIWSFYNAYTWFSQVFSGGALNFLTESSHQRFFQIWKKSKIIIFDAKVLKLKRRSPTKIIYAFLIMY